MSAPFRIQRRDVGVAEVSGVEAASAPSETFNDYLMRLMKMVPAEIVGLYLIGKGVIPDDQRLALLLWSVFCLVAVVLSRVYGTADRTKGHSPQLSAVTISTVAFVIWIYSMGGVFAAYQLYIPYIGSLLVLAWTFLVPMFYTGAREG